MKTRIFCVLLVLFSVVIHGQCAMCRAVLESEESQSAAEGINDGIVFLMAIPYLVIGTIGYFIYRTYRQQKKN